MVGTITCRSQRLPRNKVLIKNLAEEEKHGRNRQREERCWRAFVTLTYQRLLRYPIAIYTSQSPTADIGWSKEARTNWVTMT